MKTMIEVNDDSFFDLSRKQAAEHAERLWLEHHHARAGFSVWRMARRTGESLSTLYAAMKRVGMDTDPHAKRSDQHPNERARRQAERESTTAGAEQAAAAKLYQDTVKERAGTSRIVDLDDELFR